MSSFTTYGIAAQLLEYCATDAVKAEWPVELGEASAPTLTRGKPESARPITANRERDRRDDLGGVSTEALTRRRLVESCRRYLLYCYGSRSSVATRATQWR